MATVNGLTKERMIEIENRCIIDGAVDLSGHLQLEQRDGTTIDAGYVVGPQGPKGDKGDSADQTDTGWVNLGPQIVNAWVDDPIYPMQMRRIGKIVYIRGRLQGTAATNNVFINSGTTSNMFWPESLTAPPIYTSPGATYLFVRDNGQMDTPRGAQYVYFGHNWVAKL